MWSIIRVLTDASNLAMYCSGAFLISVSIRWHPIPSGLLGAALLAHYFRHERIDPEARLLNGAVARPAEIRWFSLTQAAAWAESLSGAEVQRLCNRLVRTGLLETTIDDEGFSVYAAPNVNQSRAQNAHALAAYVS